MFTTLNRNYLPATHADEPHLRKYFAITHAVNPHPAQFGFFWSTARGRAAMPGEVSREKRPKRPHL
jgi:hypothetical protein